MSEVPASGPAEKKVHRSKGVVERNLPRWFRKPGFKAWDDFLDFFRKGGAGEDASAAAAFADLDAKGDDAQPKALGQLLKFYNKHRKFPKAEVAPPWVFVEGVSREGLPGDEAWTIDLVTDLDHARAQKAAAAPKAPQGRGAKSKSGRHPAASSSGRHAAVPAGEAKAEDAPAPEPAATGVVPPPSSDRAWADALRRLPAAIQLLVDGRGKNASELNERRRRARELLQLDRVHALQKHGADMRREILAWLVEKKRDAQEIEAEVERRLAEAEAWIKKHLELARTTITGLDEHAREELKTRLRRVFPKDQDETALGKLARAAIDASRPKRRVGWAQKVIDDFNNSRGSAAEKVRDPWLLEGLLRWLSSKKDEDTPTDGEIYDQIQRLGGPNMATRKRRNEGPKEPRKAEKPRFSDPNGEDDEDEAPAPKGGRKAPVAAAPKAPEAPKAAEAPKAEGGAAS